MICNVPYVDDLLYQPLVTQTVSFEYKVPRPTDSACTIEPERMEARRSLDRVFLECTNPGWDGYDAAPIAWAAYERATAVIASLPWGYPMPTVGAEPDGHITLEWFQDPSRLLSVSIGLDPCLHYASLIGKARQFGVEPFHGVFPQALVRVIERILPP